VPDEQGFCGDGLVEEPEECEQSDVSACDSGLCYEPLTTFQCQCVDNITGICGNNLTEDPEQCDTDDDAACGGRACYPAGTPDECTCVPEGEDVCGNNEQEGWEVCDGTDADMCDSGSCYAPGTARECECIPDSDDEDEDGFFCRDYTTYESIDYPPINLTAYLTAVEPGPLWWRWKGHWELDIDVNEFGVATVQVPGFPISEQVNFTARNINTGQTEVLCFIFRVLPIPAYLLSPPELTRLLITRGKMVMNYYEYTSTGEITFWGPYYIVAEVWERK
jgi:hypothetical protein